MALRRFFQWCRWVSMVPIRRAPAHQRGKLAESNAAGHAFAARLRVAQLQKCQRHIDRTQARGAGRDPAFHVLVEAVDDRLGLACGFDTILLKAGSLLLLF